MLLNRQRCGEGVRLGVDQDIKTREIPFRARVHRGLPNGRRSVPAHPTTDHPEFVPIDFSSTDLEALYEVIGKLRGGWYEVPRTLNTNHELRTGVRLAGSG